VAEAGRLGADKSFRVLDAGAGHAPYGSHFKHVAYETADFGEVDKKYSHLDYTCRLEELPVADETYDLLLCSQVLEHLPNRWLFLGTYPISSSLGGEWRPKPASLSNLSNG
jgi:methyltransferase family protein